MSLYSSVSLIVFATLPQSSAMEFRIVKMAAMKLSVNQRVLGKSGSDVVMVTVYPSTGCVMERMTAWTGVMRKIVLKK